MTPDTIGYIFCALFIGFLVFLFAAPMIRMLRSVIGPTKTAKAVVQKKYVAQSFSKYAGNGVKEKHMIVFDIEGKTKSFQVSAFSYDGYHVKEKGTITYKGDKLLKFE